MRLVLDTDVLSRLHRGDLPPAPSKLIDGAELAITFITLGEFYKGVYKAKWGPRRVAAFEAWIKLTVVLEYDEAVAQTWGLMASELDAIGRPMPANDLWIAACCVVFDLPLLTLNRRHFEAIPRLRLLP